MSLLQSLIRQGTSQQSHLTFQVDEFWWLLVKNILGLHPTNSTWMSGSWWSTDLSKYGWSDLEMSYLRVQFRLIHVHIARIQGGVSHLDGVGRLFIYIFQYNIYIWYNIIHIYVYVYS
jgi:hypothetical protein